MTDKEFYEQCLAEEKRFEFDTFDRNDVWKLGCCLVKSASEAPGPLAATISLNGTEVFRYYPQGTGRFHEMWLTRKRNTVTTMEMASMTFKAKLAYSGSSLEEEGLDPVQYVACGGGFPIRLKGGTVIGFIGMSGLPDEDDHAAILRGLEYYFNS